MPSPLTPARALERIQNRIEDAAPETARSLRMLLMLVSPARPDSPESLAEIVSQSGVWSGLQSAMATVAYNPQGIAMHSAEEAVRELGLRRAHPLVVSLIIARCTTGLLSPASLAEAESLALASGLLARQLARRQEICDPEFGMVCALLRNYGRLLMTGLLCDESTDARALGVALDEDERYVAIFGLSPLQLSRHLFASHHFPESLARELIDSPSYLATAATFTHEEEVIRLTDLALKLCALGEGAQLDGEGVALRVDRVLEDLDVAPRLRRWDVETMFLGVVQELAFNCESLPPELDTRFIARRRLETLCLRSGALSSSLVSSPASASADKQP